METLTFIPDTKSAIIKDINYSLMARMALATSKLPRDKYDSFWAWVYKKTANKTGKDEIFSVLIEAVNFVDSKFPDIKIREQINEIINNS